jgi:thioredoxin-related protein
MKKIAFCFLLIPFLGQSQEKGVQFVHDLSWQQIKAKAKAENKFIFMDCFTTWCGPCKFMSSSVFPLESVGSVVNAHFIAVEVQLDSTNQDNAEVKTWYADAHAIAGKYRVEAYPTYLFFDPDGNLVHRNLGSSPPEVFITMVTDALDPDKQYYRMLAKYQAGERDSGFLRRFAYAALDAYDLENGQKGAEDYLNTGVNLYDRTSLQLIRACTRSSRDKWFPVLYEQAQKVDSVLGPRTAERVTQNIILREEIYSRFPEQKTEQPDWSAIRTAVAAKYPREAPELVAKARVSYYLGKRDWPGVRSAVTGYLQACGSLADPSDLNSYAWAIFQNCDDMSCISAALDWSKESFKDNRDPNFLDTYANLLYKLGKKDDAIAWEQQAADLVPTGEKKSYLDTIDKMKSGQKTW